MKDIILYCTQLRQEEKAILSKAEKRKIKIKYALTKNGVQFLQTASLAIIRTLGHTESVAISSMLELAGIKTVNSSKAIGYCTDKAMGAFLMKSHKIPQPKFDIAFSPDHLKNISINFKYPFVIKPLSSSWGRGVCLVRDDFCLENWLAGRESIDINNHYFPIMVQEYIEKPGYDIRVVVIGKKPIVAFKRKSDHWITNTHLGATVERIDIDDQIRDMINLIVAAIGSGFFGIDLFVTNDSKYLFNEINHNPDFAKSSQIHGIEISEHYLNYIEEAYNEIH